jgi:hypothetical protein
MARSMPDMPRWVKAFALLAVAVALLFAVVHFTGYWPSRHAMR